MQKLAIFRKIKSKIPDFEREKSRNYASRPQAGTNNSTDWRRDCEKRPFLDGNYNLSQKKD